MQAQPFHDYFGFDIRRREGGECDVGFDLGPQHLNLRGVAHGGVIAALLDTALGCAVISAIPAEWWCATTSLNTQFLVGPRQGPLSASGRVVRRGVKVAFAVGEVRDAADRIVATAQGTWHLWPQRPGRSATVAPPCSVVLAESGRSLRVGKIVAVGRNYADHVVEMDAPLGAPPVVFLKPSTALGGADGRLAIPTSDGQVHHEVELVAVIGRSGHEIDPADALDHVLGYAVGLDLTLRDVQSRAKRAGEPWSLAKGFDGSAPVSPVRARERVGDGGGLEITLDVNGERRQQANTSQMLHPVAELVAHVSRWMTLERGDLLFTGTPAGVGPLRPGDRVEARIAGVGELVLEIVPRAPAG